MKNTALARHTGRQGIVPMQDDLLLPAPETIDLHPLGSLPGGLNSSHAVMLFLRERRAPKTIRAYENDLADFFESKPPNMDKVKKFLALEPQQVAVHLANYKARLIEQGLKESTVNRRLSAIRSLLAYCFPKGWSKTDGRHLIDGEKVRAYRDTRGFDMGVIDRLVDAPGARAKKYESATADLKTLRDRAMLLLLSDNLLRRGEVASLDVKDFSHARRTLMILGKGRGTQKESIDLEPETANAIAEYLLAAGHVGEDGPLFRNLDRNPDKAGQRITTQAIYNAVRAYGTQIGVPELRPHKIRHTGITALSKATNGNVVKIKSISRHAKTETVLLYIDNANETQGEMTSLLADLRRKTRRK
jgi:integrase/recombinase XerC